MGFGTLVPVLAPMFRQLGLSELQAGLIQSVAAFAWFITGPWWGRRSDKVGRKQVFVSGLAGLGIGLIIVALVAQLGLSGALVAGAAYILLAFGLGFIDPGFTSGMTLAVDKHEYGAVSGLTASTNGLAAMIAPLLDTALYSVNGNAPFLFGIVLLIGIGAFVRLSPRLRLVQLAASLPEPETTTQPGLAS